VTGADPGPLLTAVLTHGLETTGRPAVPPTPPSDAQFGALLTVARRERLVGLLAAAVSDGVIPLTGAQLTRLAEEHREAMLACLALDRLALAAHEALAARGVDHAFLKGVAWAQVHYPDPSWRVYGDVDVLVHPDGWDDAVGWCRDAGGVRHYPEPRPGFDRRFGRSVAWTMPAGLELDVHRTLAPGPMGVTVRAGECLPAPALVTVAGRSLPRLDPAAELVHAALHATVGDRVPRLSALRDVAQIATVTRPPVGDVDRLARRWSVGAAVARGIRAAADRLGLAPHPLGHWAAAYRPGPDEVRWLRATLAADGSYARQALATLPALPGLRAKVAYARALAAPGRGYRDAADAGPLGRARRLLAAVTGADR
jgi:hypothetical protein